MPFERNLEGALNAQDIALSGGSAIHVGESVIDGVRRQTITTPVAVRYIPGSYRQHLNETAIRDAHGQAVPGQVVEPGSTIFA